MKNSVIYLSVVLGLISLNTNANTIDNKETDFSLVKIDSFKTKADKTFYFSDDAAILNPELYISADYSKAIEDVIKADSEITERFSNNDGLPAYQFKSAEEIIAADNEIIEAVLPQIMPLNGVSTTNTIIAPAPSKDAIKL